MENEKNRLYALALRCLAGEESAEGLLAFLSECDDELIRALKEADDPETDRIWEALLRLCPMAELKNLLSLQMIVPDTRLASPGAPRGSVALVMHIYYADLAEYCLNYALSMPEDCDVYITTGSAQKKEQIEAVFRRHAWHKLEVSVIENRGRDVSALLVAAAPKIMGYDTVCFVHDKRAPQIDWGIVGAAFSEHCFSNLLPTRAFVENVLALFARQKHLGLLTPPPPIHASYYPTLGVEWGPNYENTAALHAQLGLRCPISRQYEPIAPLGTMFYFRPAALKALLERPWRYEDFPPEPNGVDGTMLHAIERLYPYAAQDALYYSAWVLAEKNAAAELTELSCLLRGVKESAAPAYGTADTAALIARMDACWRRPHSAANPARLLPYLLGKLTGSLRGEPAEE